MNTISDENVEIIDLGSIAIETKGIPSAITNDEMGGSLSSALTDD